jgi:hypothetical protein
VTFSYFRRIFDHHQSFIHIWNLLEFKKVYVADVGLHRNSLSRFFPKEIRGPYFRKAPWEPSRADLPGLDLEGETCKPFFFLPAEGNIANLSFSTPPVTNTSFSPLNIFLGSQ